MHVDRPWKSDIDTKMLKKTPGIVNIGDSVEYFVENVFENVHGLVMWGSQLDVRRKVQQWLSFLFRK